MASKAPTSLRSLPPAHQAPSGGRLHGQEPSANDAELETDEFLAQLSHQLRGHLGSISNWLHLLSTGTLTPALQKEGLQAIEQALKAQTRIVDELDARLAARKR